MVELNHLSTTRVSPRFFGSALGDDFRTVADLKARTVVESHFQVLDTPPYVPVFVEIHVRYVVACTRGND